MSNISQVIGWKFNHQPGMRCKETKGKMKIIDFPGGIPDQADQALWTQEYEDHLLANPPIEPISADKLFNTLVAKGVLAPGDRLAKI